MALPPLPARFIAVSLVVMGMGTVSYSFSFHGTFMWYVLKRTVPLNSALVATNALLVERKKGETLSSYAFEEHS